MKYYQGRSNLAATIFVPVKCGNNCPFCNTNVLYDDFEFDNKYLDNILHCIDLCNKLDCVHEFVITGGEPILILYILKQNPGVFPGQCRRTRPVPQKKKMKAAAFRVANMQFTCIRAYKTALSPGRDPGFWVCFWGLCISPHHADTAPFCILCIICIAENHRQLIAAPGYPAVKLAAKSE